MENDFYTVKIRNNTMQKYLSIWGKVEKTPTTFAHVKKYNIYGQLKQSQVAINKKVTLNIEYCTKEDKELLETWWETKSTVWIEQDNNTPLFSTFVDTDFVMKEEINTEDGEIYYTGTLNFE